MIKHIVMWKLKQDCDKAAVSLKMKQSLEALAGKVDGLISISVGESFSGGNFDVCLVSEHTDRAALAGYDVHPLHLEAKRLIGQFVQAREACDFEF